MISKAERLEFRRFAEEAIRERDTEDHLYAYTLTPSQGKLIHPEKILALLDLIEQYETTLLRFTDALASLGDQ